MQCIAFAVPAELAPWLEARLVLVADPNDATTEAADGFCVAIVVLVTAVPAMTYFSVAPSHVSFTANGRWPHAPSALEEPGEVDRPPPADGFEGVAPSAISRTTAELDAVIGGHLFAGPWHAWVDQVRWPPAEPDGEVGGGTASEEPGQEQSAASAVDFGDEFQDAVDGQPLTAEEHFIGDPE